MTRANELIREIEEATESCSVKSNLYYTSRVRAYANLVGDDDTAENFSTAGMNREEAAEIAILTIKHFSFFEQA